MGFWEYITVWYNAIFLVPLFMMFLFAILQLVGVGLELSGSDFDVDVDTEVDADVDFEVDADADVDVDAGIDGSPGDVSFFTAILGFLNVGKVPLMVLLMTLFASWGITGLICNMIMGYKLLSAIPILAGVSAGVAFAVSIFSVKYLSLLVIQIFPESEKATTHYDLVGRPATVTSQSVTTIFGRARVGLDDGSRMQITCRIKEGDDEIHYGEGILIVDYDPATMSFEVSKYDAGGL